MTSIIIGGVATSCLVGGIFLTRYLIILKDEKDEQ